jgi:pseudouridine synthase
MALVRLNKYLASLGIASRREADTIIENGEVRINGEIVTQLGTKVDPDIDKVEVKNSVTERREKLVYIALNKPVGYVCSVQRTRQDPNIILDLVDVPERIYPVGRLDKDTTGLLILTNDGTLTFELTHPSAQSEKEYEVTFFHPIVHSSIAKLESGVKLYGQKTLPTKVTKVSPFKIRIILREGKNRQIRRICQKVGFNVKTLKRIRIKGLKLGDLPLGAWRYLGKREVDMLRGDYN